MFQEIDEIDNAATFSLCVQLNATLPRDGQAALFSGGPAMRTLTGDGHAEIHLDDLVFRIVAAFRRHPHINNVFAHISGASWSRVEQALRVILDPCAGSGDLSPLARNIVDLMCADRGITGRILKPYYRDLLANILGPRAADRLTAHVTRLFLACDAATKPIPAIESASICGSEPGRA